MRNKKKLIAEIMAVCCTLSTSTFFNMYGMAATSKELQFRDLTDGNVPLGENLAVNFKCEAVSNKNIGLLTYEIDCSGDCSPDRVNELLTLLDLKTKTGGSPITNYTTITSETEIDNVGQLFYPVIGSSATSSANSLIAFSIEANKTGGTDVLSFNATETTKLKKATNYRQEFSILRIDGKEPTIQCSMDGNGDVTNIILKIYIDLPEKNADKTVTYVSYDVTATIKNGKILQLSTT